MTPEELIEAEAEWLCSDSYGDQGENWAIIKEGEPYEALAYRRKALAHFKVMNGWGVRMVNPYTDPDWPSKDRMRVRPLPEAQTLKAMTFNQAIVELGKAHRTEAKE